MFLIAQIFKGWQTGGAAKYLSAQRWQKVTTLHETAIRQRETVTMHKTVTTEKWLAARLGLLPQDKESTRRNDKQLCAPVTKETSSAAQSQHSKA